jgi:dUTPase
MQELKIFNGFGITPTNTHVSAGTDYYVPNINDKDTQIVARALAAFEKSYGVTSDEISELRQTLYDKFGFTQNLTNIILLYLSLYSAKMKDLSKYGCIDYFVKHYLVFDAKGTPGVQLQLNDTLFINSGIKVALPHGYAGVYMNKSGKGNAGFDVRAQVVDEDYTGYVHLSQAFTKDADFKNVVYCGDKLTQMLILPVLHTTPLEVSEEEYMNEMSGSQRGDDGFGSSDVKH